jgi:hypothetical protein
MTWLVEEYDDYVKDLVAEIKRQGHDVDFINYHKMQQDNSYTGIGLPKNCGNQPDDECVLFYGSIQTAQWLQRNRKWTPTVWFNQAAYKCTNYYAYLGQDLFNQDYIILPRDEVYRNKEKIFNTLAQDGCIFARPDIGIKSFGGRIFEYERFDKDWGMVVSPNTTPSSLIVLSSPKKIKTEYRCVVTATGELVTGSQYKENGSNEITTNFPAGAITKCYEVLTTAFLSKFNPDPMYCIDICEDSEGKMYLLEINCFCSSGMYAGDLSKIVETASKLAIAEHKEIYEF